MEHSLATSLVFRLVEAFGPEAHRIIDAALDSMTTIEGAALEYDWPFWARPKQLAPVGDWRSWGFLTGRGFGKTIAIARYINEEIERRGPMQLLLVAQDEASAEDIQVNGPSGLIAMAPPWNRPEYELSAKRLVWPNGAEALVRTPEAPGKIRGPEYHMTWASELQSWPIATRAEAWSNVRLSTRLGYARLLWDATPKKRHPILRELLARNETDPRTHVVVRGRMMENAINLGPGYIGEMERMFAGTTKGREELDGEMLIDSDEALFKQEWIEKTRRRMPDLIVRRVLSVDPAVTERAGSDNTGISEAGLGVDGQALVLGDYSGKHPPHAWAKIVLDRYVAGPCDLAILETNRGGSLVTQNLRAAAAERGLRVVVVGPDETPRHTPGVVHVKEVHSQGQKQDRAQPVATAYERGRVSHVLGAALSSLEETLTTWEPQPNGKSPDDLDALVAAVVELLGLKSNKPDGKAGFVGIGEAGRQVATRPAVSPSLSHSIASVLGSNRSGRI